MGNTENKFVSTEKMLEWVGLLVGDCDSSVIHHGSIESWAGYCRSGNGAAASTSPGFYLVTFTAPGVEKLLAFFHSANDYNAYVKTYRLSEFLPYFIKVRKFTSVEYVPVTDDDTELPSRLRLSFIHTIEPDEGFSERLSGCISYALTEVFRAKGVVVGEEFKADYDEGNHWWNCQLTLTLDKSVAKTEHPDLGLALSTARFYIERGTPIRATDRAGEGTKGTRAVSALPELKGVRFQWSKAG